ncbi:nuclear autoantigenic sperm protein-like [Solea solea]|uniref:nuclear autoantigenic sperm protein-like n=1 Tax=Solea solea TaxID=90069 RepID=UPI00272CFC5D|nr:nuclear autoantigenic sperm protein-like [Solea solea]
MEEANKLIGTGKKHLVMGKVVEAVSVLQEACGMLAKTYGDTADECGEAFFWCGKALLDLARMENSVLGNALEGVPEEDDEEKPKDSNVEGTENIDEKTRDELRVQVYDAMAEKKSEDAEKVEGKQSKEAEKNGDEEPGEAEKEKKDEEKKSAEKEDVKEKEGKKEGEEASVDKKTEEGAAADKPEEEEGDSEEEEEEEVGNLQLAWEMLEVAKVIYKRKETKDDQLMAAQAHLKLGEVSAESGNYTQALDDFQECLNLQVKHLDSDSRLLAETHYQLGLTYSLSLQYSRAIKELKSSISVIKSRLDNLHELLDKVKGPEDLPGERKEMEELKALLPEIQEKVEDATEGLKLASAASETVQGVMGEGSTSSFAETTAQNGDTSSSKINGTSTNGHAPTTAPVSDISHLVRKKRKPEESPVKAGVVKKVKQVQVDDKTNRVKAPPTDGADKDGKQTNRHTNTMEVESQ